MLQIKVISFPMTSEGVSQLSKKGTNIHIASETVGRQNIFQNQEALVSLNLKTIMHKTRRINNKTPNIKNKIRFDIINSL